MKTCTCLMVKFAAGFRAIRYNGFSVTIACSNNKFIKVFIHTLNKNKIMKNLILSICLIFSAMAGFTQNGLENVIVEKFYVSDANDTNANAAGGILPVGSVTYRIFADMLPGYKFQAAYGINNPVHELRIETTTLFWNNEDRGATSPTYTKAQSAMNTVMLDSWLSVGAACSGQMGILKANDDGVATVVNNFTPQVLQNADTSAGIPVSQQDGMVSGSPEPVTAVGISTEIMVFDNQNDGTNGPVFSTTNGSWASLNGSTGPDSMDNKVLIAQITTDGVLSFELNIQIGTPTGGVENYVAQNPSGNEIQMASLTYNSLASGVSTLPPNVSSLFMVYPNPSRDLVYVEIIPSVETENNELSISDLKGSLVFFKKLNSISSRQIETIDISAFPAGTYVLNLCMDGVHSSRKILKN